MWDDITRSIADATGARFRIASRTPVGGGCINVAYRVTGDGRSYFVKTNAPHAADMFAAVTLEGALKARSHIGGTAPARVKAAIAKAKKTLA